MIHHPIIEVKNLVKRYGAGEIAKIPVLRGIDLKIYSGDFVMIFGPSGCGKSTLVNCIAGLEIFNSGEILIRGKSIKNMTEDELTEHRRDKIGLVFQQFNLIKNLNILQNIALPRMLQGKGRRSRIKRAREFLTEFGLEKFVNRLPSQLSGGQQQRVAISRALMNSPWILLVDEPTGNLDSKSATEVMNLIVDLNEKSKRTIVLVTHNVDYLKLAKRVIYMRDGLITKEEKRVIDEVSREKAEKNEAN